MNTEWKNSFNVYVTMYILWRPYYEIEIQLFISIEHTKFKDVVDQTTFFIYVQQLTTKFFYN